MRTFPTGIVITCFALFCVGCGGSGKPENRSASSSGTESQGEQQSEITIKENGTGYVAYFTQEDATWLAGATENSDRVQQFLARMTPKQFQWLAQITAALIKRHHEEFREELLAKNGPGGVHLDVVGLVLLRTHEPLPLKTSRITSGLLMKAFPEDVQQEIRSRFHEPLQERIDQGKEAFEPLQTASTVHLKWTIESLPE